MVKLGCFSIHSRSKLHSKLQKADAHGNESKTTPSESSQVVESDAQVVDLTHKDVLVGENVQEKDELKLQLGQKVKELEELSMQKDKLCVKFESLEVELKSANDQVVEVEKQLLDKDSQIQQLAQEKASDLARIEALENKLDDAKDHVVTGEKHTQQFLREKEKLQSSLNYKEINEKDLKADITKLEQQNAKLQNQILESDKKQVAMLMDKSVEAFSKSNYDEALSFLPAAICLEDNGSKRKETLGTMYNLKGDCLGKLEKYQEAVNAYSSAIKYQPNEASYYQNRALVYYHHLKDYPLARKDLKAVLTIWPDFENAKTLLKDIDSVTMLHDLLGIV